MKYLYVVISSKLNRTDHCQVIVQKASLSLSRLCRAMYGCFDTAGTQGFGNTLNVFIVYSPHTMGSITLLEYVQRRTARVDMILYE